MALCNDKGLVAPRLSVYKVWCHLTRFCVLDSPRSSSLRLVRELEYQLQGLGKTRPRDELQTYHTEADTPTIRPRTGFPLTCCGRSERSEL